MLEKRNEIFALFEIGLSDMKAVIRSSALKSVFGFPKAAPQKKDELFKLLMKRLTEIDQDVVINTVEQLTSLVKILPNKGNEVFEIMEHGPASSWIVPLHCPQQKPSCRHPECILRPGLGRRGI